MEIRELGASGIHASVVGFGAWAIGGWMWGGTDDGAAAKAIHAAIDAGINLIDTAPVYGFGKSEEVVARAISDRRDSVVLATKCGLVWHTDQGNKFFSSDDRSTSENGDISVHRCLAPEVVRYELEQTLRRMNIDHIDLYQTHWQDETTPIADTMAELMAMKAEGKIRAIGCSNATPEQMDEYRSAGTLDSDQERYSMLDRAREQTNLPYCADNNTAFLAYSPIEQGLLAGKVGPERKFSDGDQRRTSNRFSVENRKKVVAMLSEFQPVADAHQLTLAQLAIAWTVSQPGCTHALVGARTPAQASENAKAGDVTLAADELDTMRATIEKHTATID